MSVSTKRFLKDRSQSCVYFWGGNEPAPPGAEHLLLQALLQRHFSSSWGCPGHWHRGIIIHFILFGATVVLITLLAAPYIPVSAPNDCFLLMLQIFPPAPFVPEIKLTAHGVPPLFG